MAFRSLQGFLDVGSHAHDMDLHGGGGLVVNYSPNSVCLMFFGRQDGQTWGQLPEHAWAFVADRFGQQAGQGSLLKGLRGSQVIPIMTWKSWKRADSRFLRTLACRDASSCLKVGKGDNRLAGAFREGTLL